MRSRILRPTQARKIDPVVVGVLGKYADVRVRIDESGQASVIPEIEQRRGRRYSGVARQDVCNSSIAYYEELIMHRLVGNAVNQDSAAYGDRSAVSL